MKKTRMEKGITLVALIITIVVLLILAVVAIRAVQNDGIVQYAKNAASDYEKAQDKEQGLLEYYESYLSGTVGEWKQEGSTLTKTNADGTKTQIKIGDYVNYDEGSSTHTPDTAKGAGTSKESGDSTAGYTLGTSELTTEDLKWRVLGLNAKGEIELISADPTTQELYLANDEGYLNAETTYNEDGSIKELGTLDKYCNDLYGKGENATGARSLKVEDIDNLTNYDKTTYSEYGNKWTYRYPTQEEMDAFTGTENATRYMQYRTVKADGTVSKDWTNITSYQGFRLPEETTLINRNNPGSKELEYTYYYYYSIASNLTEDDGFTADEATAISNMICKGTTSSNITQWLASRCVACDSGGAGFRVRNVYDGGVRSSNLFYSNGEFYCSSRRVRPVVSLKSDISLSGSGDNIGSSENMWQVSQN